VLPWFENEEFWREAFDFVFPEARIQAAEGEAAAILALTRLPQGSAVLDLCCGLGRHAHCLARKGMRVTGVDRSAFLLDQARSRYPGTGVEWIQEDMRNFQRPNSFDLAVNLFTSFGYFEEASENLRVLENLRACLRPGGSLLIDLMGKEIVAKNPLATWSQPLGDGGLFVGRLEVLPGWDKVRVEWIFVRGESTRRFTFEHYIYSGQELKQMLLQAGFVKVELLGDLAGGPYDGHASRLLAWAKV